MPRTPPRSSTLLAWTVVLLAVLVAGGVYVRRPRATARPVVPPVVAPAPMDAAVPGPTPAVPRPARPLSVLSVDGRDTPFPAATLTVTPVGGGLHAILATDDPPAALDAGYAGNSFMFDMRLPADRPAELPAVAWEFNADDANVDADGVFLHGDRDQLQPAPGVRITFQKDGPALLAFISGPFTHLDRHDPTAPPERVQVNGCVRCLAAER